MPLPELFHEPEEAGHCPIQEGLLEHLAACMHMGWIDKWSWGSRNGPRWRWRGPSKPMICRGRQNKVLA